MHFLSILLYEIWTNLAFISADVKSILKCPKRQLTSVCQLHDYAKHFTTSHGESSDECAMTTACEMEGLRN